MDSAFLDNANTSVASFTLFSIVLFLSCPILYVAMIVTAASYEIKHENYIFNMREGTKNTHVFISNFRKL